MKAFTIYASMIGFNLDGFESWLDSLGDCPAKQELNERLRRAEAAYQAQSGKDGRIHIKPGKDDGEIVRNLEWCMTRRMMIERESEILPAARMGAEYSQVQSAKGAEGARKRWEGHKTLESVYQALAQQIDEIGDPVPTNDLWPELYAFLDYAGLDPKEIEHETDMQKDVIRWNGGEISNGKTAHKIKAEKITRGTFKNKISALRNQ